ncbi:MAG TPA: hypothetical protein VJH03_16780 [Blastocatellia bacterium]|nr:hypothetical protein [Blastocatellia bacterium]
MSAKLTIIFFILICFEIGLLLVILPWLPHPAWSENYLLYLAADKLHWPWLASIMTSGFFRGAVSGLGLLNIMLGAWEIRQFKKTVRTLQIERRSKGADSDALDAATVSDHRPAGASQSE